MSFMCKFPMKMLSKNMLSLYGIYLQGMTCCHISFLQNPVLYRLSKQNIKWIKHVSTLLSDIMFEGILSLNLWCVSLLQCNMGGEKGFEWIPDGKYEMRDTYFLSLWLRYVIELCRIVNVISKTKWKWYKRVKKILVVLKRKRYIWKDGYKNSNMDLWWFYIYMAIDSVWKCAYISGYLLDETWRDRISSNTGNFNSFVSYFDTYLSLVFLGTIDDFGFCSKLLNIVVSLLMTHIRIFFKS